MKFTPTKGIESMKTSIPWKLVSMKLLNMFHLTCHQVALYPNVWKKSVTLSRSHHFTDFRSFTSFRPGPKTRTSHVVNGEVSVSTGAVVPKSCCSHAYAKPFQSSTCLSNARTKLQYFAKNGVASTLDY